MADFVDLLSEGLSLIEVIGGIFVMFLAIGCIAMGAFLAYFGNRTKRGWGTGQLAIGVLLIIVLVWFLGILPYSSPVSWTTDVLIVGLAAGLSMVLGIAAAAGMFLLIVLKKKPSAGDS